MLEFESGDGLVFDLDGVVYRGGEPIPGAAGALARLRDEGVRILACSNNSRLTIAQYQAKLGRMGLSLTAEEVLTSALVTAGTIRAELGTGARCLVIAGEGVREALRGEEVVVDDDPFATGHDAVVVGWEPGFTYELLNRAARAVRAGASLFATNDDATFPAPGGEQWPGAGSLVAAIEVASGAKARVCGKPHEAMARACARRLEHCSRVTVVGDRPETDLAMARGRDWRTVLVLTGVTTPEQAAEIEPRPDFVINSAADLSPRA